MTADEKKSIVDSLVAFLVHVATLALDHAGRLGEAPESFSITKQSQMSRSVLTSILIHNQGFEVSGRVVRKNQPLPDLLSCLLHAQYVEESLEVNPVSRMWSDLVDLQEEMTNRGFFHPPKP